MPRRGLIRKAHSLVFTQLALVECPVLLDTIRDDRPSRMTGAEQTRISDLLLDRLPPVLGAVLMDP